MRRIISILLVTMLVLSFVGCDTKDASSGKSSHEHNYTKEEVIVEARCNQDGKVKCECECGNSILKDIDKLSEHKWQDATCVKAKTCVWCGLTEGLALEHDWKTATCTEPKTCKVCGMTEGNPVAHLFENAKCAVCGAINSGDATKINGCTLTLNRIPYEICLGDANMTIQELNPNFTSDANGNITLNSFELFIELRYLVDSYTSYEMKWEIFNSRGLLVDQGVACVSPNGRKLFSCEVLTGTAMKYIEVDNYKLVLS